MAERTYGTTVIPGDQITIIGGGTIAVSTAFSRTVALVGGMDVEEGEATPGEVQTFRSQSTANDLFGEDSELFEASRLAINNRAREVKAVAVEETHVEGEELSEDGVLENAPIFDPSVQYDEEIVVQDEATEIDVNIVYDDDDLADPDEDTINLNPITGSYEAFATGYEIDYGFGDYEAAIDEIAPENARTTVVLSESEDLANYLDAELESEAEDFGFSHGVTGAPPNIESDFEHNVDAPRISMVSTSRGYIDDAQTTQARTAAAVGGHLASLPLGSSSTYDSIRGFTGLVDDFRPSEAGELIDNRIMPIIQNGRIFIVKDMTTSKDVRFERVYSNEIVDEATELSHLINQQFIGELNTDENRQDLLESHETAYTEMVDDRPPLLDDYAIDLSVPDDDPNAVELEIGLDVVNVIDTIDVTIVVGDVITNGGAN